MCPGDVIPTQSELDGIVFLYTPQSTQILQLSGEESAGISRDPNMLLESLIVLLKYRKRGLSIDDVNGSVVASILHNPQSSRWN